MRPPDRRRTRQCLEALGNVLGRVRFGLALATQGPGLDAPSRSLPTSGQRLYPQTCRALVPPQYPSLVWGKLGRMAALVFWYEPGFMWGLLEEVGALKRWWQRSRFWKFCRHCRRQGEEVTARSPGIPSLEIYISKETWLLLGILVLNLS